MELVEVEGGNDWKIRKLAEKYDEVCWTLASSSTIVQFELGELKKRDESSLPTFHCKVVRMETPLSIGIQPKYLDHARQNMMELLNKYYNEKSELLKADQFVEGIACCVKIRDKWYRAILLELTKSDICYVRLVDFGEKKMIDKGQLRTLLPRFGRVPQMALECTVKGLLIHEMENHKILEFQKVLESFNHYVRCQLLSDQPPFLINLLHPTVTGKNLCEQMFSKRPLVGPSKYVPENREDSDDCDSFFDSDSDGKKEQPEVFIKEFARATKAIRLSCETFTIVHVEHANLIYLTCEGLDKTRDNIEKLLETEWNSLPTYPISWFVAGNACVTKNYQRATIVEVDDQHADLLLIDHTYVLKNVPISDIRPVPASDDVFSSPPQVVAVSLYSQFRLHYGAINVLRKILKVGSIVKFKPYTKSKTTPNRGDVLLEDANVEDLYIEAMKVKRIRPNCQDLVLYKPKTGELNLNYVYTLYPPKSFIKGNLIIEELSQ